MRILLALLLFNHAALAFTKPERVPTQPGSHIRFREHIREHSFSETSRYVGILYGINVIGYITSQAFAIQTKGSWQNYRNNLFKVSRADYDVWNYNWGTHVLTGAASNLFYRSRGYTRADSLFLTALQSALFEFTIEVYTEPASLEDLINTPVLGSAAATLLEWSSFAMLNSESSFLQIMGHILNPFTLFGFHEGQVDVHAKITSEIKGVAVRWSY